MAELYTPFVQESMGNIMGSMTQKAVGKALPGAYMGDQSAMDELMRLDPEAGASVLEYGNQQAQQDLENQRKAAIDKQRTEAQQREFAESNQELMTGLMEDLSYFDDPVQAAEYANAQVAQMRELGIDVPDMELTPERFAQIKQLNLSKLGQNQETVGSPYMVERQGADGKTEIVTAVAVRDKKKGGLKEVILEGAAQRVTAYDADRAREVSGAKKTGAIEAEIDLADDKAFSELRADAKVKLRPARLQAQQSIKTINSLRDHPGREAATGLSNWLDPRNHIAGTDAYDFSVLASQAQGQIFAEAFKTLKGGGQITEIESRKASEAIARMEASASEAEYLLGLQDFENAVRDGYQLMLDNATATAESTMKDTALDAPATMNEPARPTSQAEYDALPSGSYYIKGDKTLRKR